MSFGPLTVGTAEETSPHLTTTSFQVLVESNEVHPEPPFLWAKQPQLPLCVSVPDPKDN